MNLKPIKNNCNELELKDGTRVLFSYQTPVAFFKASAGYFVTSTWFSKTTSRHISQWTEGRTAQSVNQYDIEKLVRQ